MGIRKLKPAGKAAPRVATGAFARVLVPSPALAAIVGAEPLTRPAALAAVWNHIRAAGCQDAKDRRTIVSDDTLRPVLGERCNMLAVPGKVSVHLSAMAA